MEKCIINIGTDKQNIVGIKIDKEFKDIEYRDIMEICMNFFGDMEDNNIQGWCDVTNK